MTSVAARWCSWLHGWGDGVHMGVGVGGSRASVMVREFAFDSAFGVLVADGFVTIVVLF